MAGLQNSGGCKMAYGSGPSLTDLTFTPYYAVYMSKMAASYYYWSVFYPAARGVSVIQVHRDGSVMAKCSFGDNSVTFSQYPGANFYNVNSYTVAFGY